MSNVFSPNCMQIEYKAFTFPEQDETEVGLQEEVRNDFSVEYFCFKNLDARIFKQELVDDVMNSHNNFIE